MDYNPDDRRATLGQVLAGWVLCLAMLGVAFAAAGQHQALPSANAGDPPRTIAAACCPTSGVRLPYFASCGGRVRMARGAVSLPVDPCG